MLRLHPETYLKSTGRSAGRYFGRYFHNREIPNSLVGIVSYSKKCTKISWFHHFKVGRFKVPLRKNCFFLTLRRIDYWNNRCWLTLAFPKWFLSRKNCRLECFTLERSQAFWYYENSVWLTISTTTGVFNCIFLKKEQRRSARCLRNEF